MKYVYIWKYVYIRKCICKCKYSGMILVYLLRNKGEIFIWCKIVLYSYGEIRNIYFDIWYCFGYVLVI